MGLWDKRSDKKKQADDFDSPVEHIDLSAPVTPAPQAVASTQDSPAIMQDDAMPPPASRRAAPEPDFYGQSYGIDKAIQLMRTLPSDNVELVVQVVKHTLESTNVHIPEIIGDARRKQDDIQGRIKVLRDEIAEFEREIESRREEISRLDADYKETSLVRERLELAENLGKKKPPEGPGSGPGEGSKSSSGVLGSSMAAGSMRPSGTSSGSGPSASANTNSSGAPPASAASASNKPPATASKTTIVAKK